jgi:proteasome accessory factor A
MLRRAAVPHLPKLCGADIELGNFVLGVERPDGTGAEASRALLREIDGISIAPPAMTACACPACSSRRDVGAESDVSLRDAASGDPQDWGRKFLPSNGGCAYVDLDHLELCLPEVLSAYDHVACWHAMLRTAQAALAAANARQPEGRTIQALVNNSDGSGNSYGSHLNFLVTRRAWDDIFHRKLHYMAYLAAFQTSSIVFTGQGKVGSENGAPLVEFQLSQRADFFETVTGVQTTFRRPLVNSRDEPLCGRGAGRLGGGNGGPERDMARLHVIFFDNTLCPVASLLKVGATQIVLAMIEAGRVDLGLSLDDPLAAVTEWSHDPRLEARAALTSRRKLTAVEVQLSFCEQARSFVDDGKCEGIVPRAAEIVTLWEDTLLKLQARDLPALAPRLDWVLKLALLERAQRGHAGMGWSSPEIKHLDHLYSSLDPEEGLYWALAKSGFVETVVDEGEVVRFVHEPPEDTRAWGRAMVLRCVDARAVAEVDWDCIRLRVGNGGWESGSRTLDLANPLASTRAELEPALERASTLDDVLDALEAAPSTRRLAATRKRRRGQQAWRIG